MPLRVQARVWGSVTGAVVLVNVPSCLRVACWEWMLPFWVQIQNLIGVGSEQRWPLVAVKRWVNRGGFRVIFWDLSSIIVHSPDSQHEVFCHHHRHGVCRQFQESLSLKWSCGVYKQLALAPVSAFRIIQIFLTWGICFVLENGKDNNTTACPCSAGVGLGGRRDKMCLLTARAASLPSWEDVKRAAGCASASPPLPSLLSWLLQLDSSALSTAAFFSSWLWLMQRTYLKPGKRASHMERLCLKEL